MYRSQKFGIKCRCLVRNFSLLLPDIISPFDTTFDTHSCFQYRLLYVKYFLGCLSGSSETVACPTPDCNGYQFVLDADGPCARIQCEVCNASFGSKCREPYHYKADTCDEVVGLRARYEQWKNEQRAPFLLAMKKDLDHADNAEQRAEYEEKRVALEKEEENEEQLKQGRPCCTSCHRLVSITEEEGAKDGKVACGGATVDVFKLLKLCANTACQAPTVKDKGCS